MGWFDKKKKPDPTPSKEPSRTPGRTSTHTHSYTIVISDITNVSDRRAGGAGRAVTRACTCGMTTTTSS